MKQIFIWMAYLVGTICLAIFGLAYLVMMIDVIKMLTRHW